MPSMVHVRNNHACSIFRSSAHNGRPVAIAAGGGVWTGSEKITAEVWDYTITGSSWQLSKHISATYFYFLYLIHIHKKSYLSTELDISEMTNGQAIKDVLPL